MARKKSKPKSPFLGRWHIVSMSSWDEDYLNEEVPAFIELEEKQKGEFHFGNVQGIMDYREGQRDGKPCVEWSWDGNAEMDLFSGRGWAMLEGDKLVGMLFIHQGDESDFEAERTKRK